MIKRGHSWHRMTPRQVRLASIVAGTCLVVQHIVMPTIGVGPLWLTLPLGFVGAVGGWPLLMWLAVSAPGWGAVMPGELDERERADRASSFVIAHRITGLILLPLGCYCAFLGTRFGLELPAAETGYALLWSLAWLHVAMPGIVLAWREDRSIDQPECEEANGGIG